MNFTCLGGPIPKVLSSAESIDLMRPDHNAHSYLVIVLTGAKLGVQLFNEMRRRKQKYGVVIRRTADAWGPGRGRRVCSSC